MDFSGCSLQRSVALATRNPSCLLGISPRKGIVETGCDADFVLLTPSGDVVHTFIAGRLLKD
jgi:N-acetylglucosamine-6-phosphate deacetylase